jgi:hypothetical protein
MLDILTRFLVPVAPHFCLRRFISFLAEIKCGLAKKVWSVPRKLPDEYTVLNDLILHTETGTTQITIVVVSPWMFVIETKNYKGWIFGGENPIGTQNIYGHKNSFMNRSDRICAHVKAVEARRLSCFLPLR